MKPSSKNEVMNGIVNAYIAQKSLDKANNTHYADTWKILNGADDEIDASLKFDLSEGEWDSVKTYLKENKISFALCLISYKDGHSQNSFVWYDDEHIYATEMNEIGSVSFHVVDNANKEIIKPTDETSSSILKMLLALENRGANGGGGETTTKQVFKGGVDILDKPLDVESKATFGADVEVDGSLTINSAKDLKTKDGSSFGGGGLPSPWVANENVLGYEDTENQLVVGFLAEGGNLYGYKNKQSGEISYVSPALSGAPNIIVYLNVNTQVESAVVLPDNFVTKSQMINLGDINKKQNILVSGTNIKTINNQSILGEGNIDTGGGDASSITILRGE